MQTAVQKCILVSAQIAVAQYYINVCKKNPKRTPVFTDGLFYFVQKMCIAFPIFKVVLQCLCVLTHIYAVLIYISIAL